MSQKSCFLEYIDGDRFIRLIPEAISDEFGIIGVGGRMYIFEFYINDQEAGQGCIRGLPYVQAMVIWNSYLLDLVALSSELDACGGVESTEFLSMVHSFSQPEFELLTDITSELRKSEASSFSPS